LQDTEFFLPGAIQYHERNYSAGGQADAKSHIVIHEDQLQLKAMILDIIEFRTSTPYVPKLAKLISESYISISKIHELVARLQEAMTLFESQGFANNETDDNQKQRLWRTITDDFNGGKVLHSKTLQNILENLEILYGNLLEALKIYSPTDETLLYNGLPRSVLAPVLPKSKFTPIFEHGELDMNILSMASHIGFTVFAISKEKYLALVQRGVEERDLIVIFQGAAARHIICPTSKGDESYFLIAEAYVDGVMHVEALTDSESFIPLILRQLDYCLARR
jgi:hypothetical protein